MSLSASEPPVVVKPAPVGVSVVAKLALLMAGILVLLLSAVLVGEQFIWKGILREEIDTRLTAVVAGRRDVVRANVAQLVQRASVNADRGEFRSFLGQRAEGVESVKDRTFSEHTLKRIADGAPVLEAALVDMQGLVVVATEPAKSGLSPGGEPVAPRALEAVRIGPTERVGERFVVRVAAPVKTFAGAQETCGALLLTVDVTPMAESVQDIVGVGETGDVMLVAPAGNRIRFLFPSRHGRALELAAPSEAPATAAAIWDWNIVTGRMYYSPRWAEMRGCTPAEISDRVEEWSSRIHPDDTPRVLAALQAHVDGETPVFSEEYRIACKDGSWKWVHDRGIARRNAAGEAIRMAGSETDITERKRAEEQIKASLHEKEVLLREVHHRVKNNLQIVSSLLSLQGRRLTDPALIAGFASTRERVRAMASVHERLYQTGDFAAIDLAAQVGRLARMLTQAHAPEGVRLRCEPRLEPVVVDMNTAVPLSLIVNEVILNAAKYAYIGRSDGVLKIELRAGAEQHELRIADDGPGLPAGVDPATTKTLGLRLVHDLARQIRAEVHIESSSAGTGIRIVWPARPHEESPPPSP